MSEVTGVANAEANKTSNPIQQQSEQPKPNLSQASPVAQPTSPIQQRQDPNIQTLKRPREEESQKYLQKHEKPAAKYEPSPYILLTHNRKKRPQLSFEEEIEQEQVLVPSKGNSEPLKKGSLKKKEPKPVESAAEKQENIPIQEQLRLQYLKESQKIKDQYFELDVCYWETRDIVKKIHKQKKVRVAQLVEIGRLELVEYFQDLVKLVTQDLLFVVKDFVVPHSMTIHELEVLKLKTKTGEPLLNFHTVKMKKDMKEQELSVNLDGPVILVQKTLYEKNKAIHPFCNWFTIDLPKNNKNNTPLSHEPTDPSLQP